MSSPFKTPEFKKLFKKWNKKLKDSGFEDAEDFNLTVPLPYDWHNFRFKKFDPQVMEERQIHFQQARDMLNTFPFKNVTHKRIWELYSEGETLRAISKILNSKKYKKSTVGNIINAIKKEMR